MIFFKTSEERSIDHLYRDPEIRALGQELETCV